MGSDKVLNIVIFDTEEYVLNYYQCEHLRLYGLAIMKGYYL